VDDVSVEPLACGRYPNRRSKHTYDTPVNLARRTRLSSRVIRLLPRVLLALAFGALLAPVAPAAPPASADPGLPSMPVLATVQVTNGEPTSMAIAFDGEVFYFLDSTADNLALTRVRLTGTPPNLSAETLPMVLLPVPASSIRPRIAYDARHRAILVATTTADVHTDVRRYDLRTHRVVSTVRLVDDQVGGFTYDWFTDRFMVSADNINVVRYDALGRRRTACLAGQGPVLSGLSGLLASGDGEVYEQLEDDQTLLRAVPGCRTTGSWAHRILAEATAEDDSLACDGATFGVPAVWVRDAATLSMTAYGLPAGRCVLPTALTLAALDGRACARLSRAEVAVPLAGQPVTVAGQAVRTGADGTACAAVPTTPGSHSVVASYAGSRGWAPSRATAAYGIAPGAAPPPGGAPGRQVSRRLGPVPGPGSPGTPAGPPGTPPGPAAQHVPGPQPAPDPAPAGVPVTNALPAGVTVPRQQERGEPVYAMLDANAAARSSMAPVVQALGAALASALAVTVAARRRTAPAYNRR
jgi:hypothetical protein